MGERVGGPVGVSEGFNIVRGAIFGNTVRIELVMLSVVHGVGRIQTDGDRLEADCSKRGAMLSCFRSGGGGQ